MSIKIDYIICLLNFLLRKMDAHLKDCCCNLWDRRGGGVEMLHGVQYLRKKSCRKSAVGKFGMFVASFLRKSRILGTGRLASLQFVVTLISNAF